MTFFIYTGQPRDYDSLGFSVTNGQILDGTASDPEVTTPPDANWSVTASGPETVTRHGQNPGGTPSPPEPTDGYILRYSDADNAYIATDPQGFVALTPVANAIDTAADTALGTALNSDVSAATTTLVSKINNGSSAVGSALTASTDARIAEAAGTVVMPALVASQAGSDRLGYRDPSTGLYLASRAPLRKIQTAISRAVAGVEACRIVYMGDSIEKVQNYYVGTHVDLARKIIRARYGIATLTGLLFMVDRGDNRITYPAGSTSDFVSQVGVGPAGASALRSTSAGSAARIRMNYVEDDAFDQVAVYYENPTTSAREILVSVNGAAEAPLAIPATYGYGVAVVSMGSLATGHHITFGWGDADAATRARIVAIEPRRSDKKYISVTRGGIGGAQSRTFVRLDTGYEQYTGANKFYPKMVQPHLLSISLGVNDWKIPDAFQVQTSIANYKTYLTEVIGWKHADGVALLKTQVPNQDTATAPPQTDYNEALYDLVDASPANVMLTDLYDAFGSYTDMGGTTSGNYSDATHPSMALQGFISELNTRWTRTAV